jgi:hypothetical protein
MMNVDQGRFLDEVLNDRRALWYNHDQCLMDRMKDENPGQGRGSIGSSAGA